MLSVFLVHRILGLIHLVQLRLLLSLQLLPVHTPLTPIIQVIAAAQRTRLCPVPSHGADWAVAWDYVGADVSCLDDEVTVLFLEYAILTLNYSEAATVTLDVVIAGLCIVADIVSVGVIQGAFGTLAML